jgi:hypothetical protein
MGALFVFVVTLMPQGIGGVLESLLRSSKGEVKETTIIPAVIMVAEKPKEKAHS